MTMLKGLAAIAYATCNPVPDLSDAEVFDYYLSTDVDAGYDFQDWFMGQLDQLPNDTFRDPDTVPQWLREASQRWRDDVIETYRRRAEAAAAVAYEECCGL